MKALIMKDIYVVWKQMRTFVVILILMSVFNTGFNSVFVVVWCSLLPYTAAAYDERSHWNQLAVMMPYSRWDLVASKYALGWLSMLAAMVLCGVTQAAASPFTHTPPNLFALAASLFGGAIAIAVTMPLVLRFGVERGRMVFLVVIFGVAIIGGAIGSVFESAPAGLTLPLMALLPVAAVIATAVSIPLSMKLYRAE